MGVLMRSIASGISGYTYPRLTCAPNPEREKARKDAENELQKAYSAYKQTRKRMI